MRAPNSTIDELVLTMMDGFDEINERPGASVFALNFVSRLVHTPSIPPLEGVRWESHVTHKCSFICQFEL
jgi:hypothetical protein